jgi:hypothetical protein
MLAVARFLESRARFRPTTMAAAAGAATSRAVCRQRVVGDEEGKEELA